MIGAQIRASRWLLSFATAFPSWFYRMVENRESLWTKFCDVLCGDADFTDLRADVVWPFARLIAATEPLLGYLALRRIRCLCGESSRDVSRTAHEIPRPPNRPGRG